MTDNVDVTAMQSIAKEMLDEARATRADIADLSQRLDDFRIRTELRFESVERRIGVTDNLVISLAHRLEGFEKKNGERFDVVENRLDVIERRLDTIDGRLERLEGEPA